LPITRWQLEISGVVAAHRLRIVAGQNARPRRPAARRVVELREAQAARREAIQVRRLNLSAVTAGIREAHVIGDDKQDVGFGRGRLGRGSQQGGRSHPQKCNMFFHWFHWLIVSFHC